MFHETLLHTQNHGNSNFLLLSSDQCSILLVVIGNVTGVEMIKWYPMSLDCVWTRGWPSVSVDTTLQCPALVTIVSPLQYRGQLIQMRPINPSLLLMIQRMREAVSFNHCTCILALDQTIYPLECHSNSLFCKYTQQILFRDKLQIGRVTYRNDFYVCET